MSALPILYSFRRCPYAIRARMALGISGLAVEHREVALSAKPAALLEASPKGTVPVLVDTDGAVIAESLDIMRWALSHHDPEDWLSGQDVEVIAANDGPFKHHLDRYKYPDRHGDNPLTHRAEALNLLAPLEARLQHHANLCGERRSFTDIALFPFVRQFAAVDQAWFDTQPLPNLRRWLAAHLASPHFQTAMARHDVWRPATN